MSKTLYLIDGHAQIYRAFYAVDPLTAPDGRPTNAAFGVTRMLLHLLKEKHPDHLVAVFDAPGKTFRHEQYTAYKATRKPTPPELLSQIPLIHDLFEAFGIPIFSIPGVEADDVLGTLAKKGAAEGLDVVLVSGDKDLQQLLAPGIVLFDPMKNTLTREEDFTVRTGIRPDQLPDLMGLWGDTADNIPGVPGIGEKTGLGYLQKFGDLDTLLERAGEIPGKRGIMIRKHIDQARLSRDLATIRTDVDVRLDLPASRCDDAHWDRSRLHALFVDLGFRSFLSMLEAHVVDPPPETRDYVLVNTEEAFESFLRACKRESLIAFDTETTSTDPMRAVLVGVSVSWAERGAFYLPFRAPEGERVLDAHALAQLKPLLEDPAIRKTGQNLKYDALVLARVGITLRGIAFDTLLASAILEGHKRNHDLDTLSEEHLGIHKIPTKELLGTGRKQVTMDQVPLGRVCDYACEDADCAWRLTHRFAAELDRRKERALLEELELPLSLVLTTMQRTGIRVDASMLKRQSEEMTSILDTITEEIHELAGHPFNIASPAQLAEVLFVEMGLPVKRKTKTGASTDEAVLTALAEEGHELPRRMLDVRFYAKLKSTYLDALPDLIHPETGRIHATFSQTVTATGRLSSSNPNLQNIPVRSTKGRAIRAAFIPEPGWQMLAADYSQVELRMLAHFCGDEKLREAFAQNRDIHRVTAAALHGIDEDAVTDDQRADAKAVNFGILYGQSAHGLSASTDMNRVEAQTFIDAYFARFPRIRAWIDDTISQAHAAGGVKTILGRRRMIPDLKSGNRMIRARAEREAVNTVIQGSAADLIKRAMIRLHARMEQETPSARMLLQIHDELVLEAPPEEMPRLQEIVREEMEQAMDLSVPFRVEMGVGANWLEAK